MDTNAAKPLIGVNALSYYLKRITAFLESDKKTLSFPNISQELQDILVRIAMKNTEFLIDGHKYNNNVKMEAAKLYAVINRLKNFKLTHEIGSGNLGLNVLMYKKTEVNTFKVPDPLRKPSVITPAPIMELPIDESVTQVFKTRCLNATTKFVKDDSQLVMRYPEMVAAQAEFVMGMIQPGIQKTEKLDVGFGYRSMYAPLWESMKVFSLKYDYKLDCNTRHVTKDGMKRIVFEKRPKCKTSKTGDSDSSETPVVIIDLDDEETLENTDSSSTTASINDIKPNIPKCKSKKAQRRKNNQFIQKLRLHINKKEIDSDFLHDALRRISDFLKDDQRKTLLFEQVSPQEMYFLTNVRCLCFNTGAYMLFGSDCQKFLSNIMYYINMRNVHYNIKPAKGLMQAYNESLKSIIFEKIPSKASEGTDIDASALLNTSTSPKSPISASSGSESQNCELKKPEMKHKKADKKLVSRLSADLGKGLITNEFIEKTLQRICDFMCDELQASIELESNNPHQLHFIQKAGQFARDPASYKVFTDKSQKILANINCCFIANTLFHMKLAKACKGVILRKIPKFEPLAQNKTGPALKKEPLTAPSVPSTAPEIIDVETYESLNTSISSVSTTSVSTNSSAARKPTKKQVRAAKMKNKVVESMQSGLLSEQFIQTTLQRILDFLNDDQLSRITLSSLSPTECHFMKNLTIIVQNESWHGEFGDRSRKLLADLNCCFKNKKRYQFRRHAVTKTEKEILLYKPALVSPLQLMIERENNKNVNNITIENPPRPTAPLSKSDQDRLIRLKAIKDTVARDSGELALLQYLQDIANFLTHTNTDSVLTFDKVTEDEALFLKYVHVMSSLEATYCMFSRECQILLKSIQVNARAFKLKFHMNSDVKKGNLRTVAIEKQNVSNENKEPVARTARKAEPSARGASTHRLNVKDQLKAALAQPVHSDIALRMMESMGWEGGALGLRGNGITEPIALPLDLTTRAGLGHVPKPKKLRPEPKTRKPCPPKRAAPATSSAQLPPGFQPVSSLSPDVIPPGILPAGLLEKCKTVVLDNNYHATVLRSILEIITSDFNEMHFMCTKSPSKVCGFLKHAVASFNGRHPLHLSGDTLNRLVGRVSRILDQCGGVHLSAEIRNRTDLYPLIGVVKKTRRMPVQRKNINEVIIIDDEQETKDDQETTINDQSLKRNDQDTTTDQDSTDPTKIWYLTETTTIRSCRPWYLPIKSFSLYQVTTKNYIPELKLLALKAVCKLENIETNIKTIPNDQGKTVRTKPSFKSSATQKVTVKTQEQQTTKMITETSTTKQLLISNLALKTGIKNEETMYTETKQRNADSLEMSSKPKKMKLSNDQQQELPTTQQQDSKTTEIKKLPGVLLLEKLTLNNNDSTNDKNAPATMKSNRNKAVESTVSVRFQNAVAECKIRESKDNEFINNAPAVDNVNIFNNVALIGKISPTTSELSDTSLCKRTENMKIVDYGNTEPNDDSKVTQSDVESVSNVPCTSKMTVDSVTKNNIAKTIPNKDFTNENNDIKENCASQGTSTTNSVSKNDIYEEDDECQIIFDDDSQSAFVIDSDDEKILLSVVDEINEATINLIEDNEKDAIIFPKENTSRKVMKPKYKRNKIKESLGCTYEIVNDNCDYIDTEFENQEMQPASINIQPAPVEIHPAPIHERKRQSLENPIIRPKKYKLLADFKKIYILPKDYPRIKMDCTKARKIQSAILKSINYTKETLPFLKCLGIQNGGLIYSCKDEKSLYFLENLIHSMDDLKLVHVFNVEEQLNYKMAFRINSYIDESIYDVFNRLELYNTGLNTAKWSVIKKEQNGDFTVMYVEVDKDSFNYISEADFILYAGNDCARFTIVWD